MIHHACISSCYRAVIAIETIGPIQHVCPVCAGRHHSKGCLRLSMSEPALDRISAGMNRITACWCLEEAIANVMQAGQECFMAQAAYFSCCHHPSSGTACTGSRVCDGPDGRWHFRRKRYSTVPWTGRAVDQIRRAAYGWIPSAFSRIPGKPGKSV